MVELWYPGALKHFGPAWKNRGSTNSAEGVVWHSAEGSWGGLQYELARSDRSAAWHFSCRKDGTLYQHYPLNAVLYHAGDWGDDQDGADGNGETIGIEFEGVAGEQLTPQQIRTATKFVAWLAPQAGWTPKRTAVGRNQWEHRELSNLGTSCPSDRMPWPVIMREFAPAVKVSAPLDPNKPLFWPAVFDAVMNSGTLGSHERLPEEKVGYGTYKFHLRY